MKIGDHEFINGLCIVCGRKWVDVRHVDETYVNEGGYACKGALTASEIPDYVREREREDAAIAAALEVVVGAR